MHISELEEICIDIAKGVYGGHSAWQMDTARKQSVKEHEIVREALEKLHLEDVIDGKESELYHEEYQVEYFVADFYVPKANLIIEINSKQHFYPYTYKKDQVTNRQRLVKKDQCIKNYQYIDSYECNVCHIRRIT